MSPVLYDGKNSFQRCLLVIWSADLGELLEALVMSFDDEDAYRIQSASVLTWSSFVRIHSGATGKDNCNNSGLVESVRVFYSPTLE